VSDQTIALAAIALVAAIVNGALGYGFSSLTVPLALLFLASRVLNPALVFVEVFLNVYVLWVNRRAAPSVWRRVTPILMGLAPGVIVGTAIVSHVSPNWVKFATFALLLPLILLQAAGYRRPIRAERKAGLAFGMGVGTVYSLTTVSGPPLALLLNNQGLAKQEFRAALGIIRLTESTLTALAYALTGLFTAASLELVPIIVPGVLLGVPIGAWLIRHIQAETFRRVCMSFDAWVVGFGISMLLRVLGLVPGAASYSLFGAVAVIDAWLLYHFFQERKGSTATATARARERRP
jgi:uncharacterized membrane protein YfcA